MNSLTDSQIGYMGPRTNFSGKGPVADRRPAGRNLGAALLVWKGGGFDLSLSTLTCDLNGTPFSD